MTIKKKFVAFGEIFLLVSFSFAFAFLISDYAGFGSAQIPRVIPAANVPASGGSAGGGGTATGLQGILSGSTFGTGATTGGVASSLFSGLAWGALIGGALYLVSSIAGFDDGLTNALVLSGGLGGFAGATTYFLASNNVFGATLATQPALLGIGVGLGVGAAVFILTYEDEKKEIVRFECLPWEPPYGGNSCDKCNGDSSLPCSEYRCKSLGQSCDIVNKGSDEEKCVWLNKDDTTAPKLNPSEDALSPKGLRYSPDSAISPPNRGFKILNVDDSNGCLEPFSKFKFGVETDELAKCKVDFKRTPKFDDMQYPLGNSQLFRTLHVQELPVMPVPDAASGVSSDVIHNDGTVDLYIRCVDANGNGQDSAEVSFKFCIDKGPDLKPPIVQGTSIPSGSPVLFDADKVNIELYVNEPSTCKWSPQDKDYGAMENTMSCASGRNQFNSRLDFTCTSTLTGIKNQQDNNFYFRCQDKSPAANTMRESYPLILKGTQPLVIDKVGPRNVTISGPTSSVNVNLTVQTSHGAEEGKAICGYSTTDDLADYLDMDYTNSYTHSQVIPLTAGDYAFYFRCTDAGGNTVVANTTFKVDVDTQAPLITRILKEDTKLKVITDEEANCAYSTTNCNYNFADGLPLSWEGGNKMLHLTDWNAEVTYYLKCKDLRNREPPPDKCQVIVKGSEF